MAKPYTHAVSSAKQFGGEASEYIKFHDWMDQSKSHIADVRHRCILHSSFGIFLGEQFFGAIFKNSNGRDIPVRSILEQHVLEDLGFIPTVQDYLCCMKCESWMYGAGLPKSHPKFAPSQTEIDESLELLEKI